MALSSLNVKIGADTSGFDRGLKRIQSGVKEMKSGLSSLVKTGLGLAGAALGVKSLVDAYKSYTNLESSIQRTNSLFGEASKYVHYFAENTGKGLGMAEGAAYQYAATYGNLFKNITKDSTQNAAVTIAMMKASAVVASQTGRTMEDVNERIRSGLLGSTEAIEDLGINVNVGMLEMTDAFKKIADGRSWNQLNFYEQQQVRTMGILEQASKNFGNSVIQGPAYGMAVLSGSFKDFIPAAGLLLSGVFQPVIKGLTLIVQWATIATKSLAAVFGLKMGGGAKSLSDAAKNQVALAGSIGDASGVAAAGADANQSLADSSNNAAKAAKKQRNALLGFQELNIANFGAAGESGNQPASGGSPAGAGLDTSIFDAIDVPEYKVPELETSAFEASLKRFIGLFDFDPIKASWSAFLDSFKPIKSFVFQGFFDFYNRFLVPVAKWTIGTGLPRFIDGLTFMNNNIDWGKINAALRGVWDVLAPFAQKVGEGLLWFWENVLVPFNTWTMSNVVPLFLDVLASGINILNQVIDAVAPQINWLWQNFLKPIASWTGGVIISVLIDLSNTLAGIGNWMQKNIGTIKTITTAVGAFFLAWKGTELLAFVQMSGGVLSTLSKMGKAIWAVTGAKIADKAQTMALTALYAKDFVMSLVSTIAMKGKELAAWIATTAAKVADKIATIAATIATYAMTIAQGLLNMVMAANPIVLIVIAIAALVAAFVALWKNCEGFRQFWIDLWEGIKSVVSTVVNAISKFLSNAWNTIKSAITSAWNAIKNFFTSIFNAIKNTAMSVWNGICNFFSGIWNEIKNIASSIWNGISNFFSGIWDGIRNTITAVWNGISSFFSGVWSGISSGISGAWNGILNFFRGFANAVKGIFQGIGDFVSGIWSGIVGAFKAVVNAVIGGVNWIIRQINKIGFNIPKWLGGGRFGFNIREIPYMAKGGVVTGPTVAMIGEQGKEAVVPLENNTGWLDQIASRLSVSMANSGGGNAQPPVIQLVFGGRIIRELLVEETSRATLQAGKTVIRI